MRKNRVFMNRPRLEGDYERVVDEMLDHMLGLRPLHGTNLEWIYRRGEGVNAQNQRAPEGIKAAGRAARTGSNSRISSDAANMDRGR